MKAYLLPPRISLVEQIAAELDCEGKDFSKNLIVFPGKRPAHFLRKIIARRAGGSFIPPVILSMDEFIDQAFASIDDRRKIDPLDAVAMLYDIHCGATERIGGDGFKTLDAFFSIGLKLYRDLEELLIEQVTAGRLREICIVPGEAIPEPSQQRVASFEIFFERF